MPAGLSFAQQPGDATHPTATCQQRDKEGPSMMTILTNSTSSHFRPLSAALPQNGSLGNLPMRAPKRFCLVVSFLHYATPVCGLDLLCHASSGSKDVTQEQTDLASLAQSLVKSRISADAPRQTLIRTIVRACDDARGLMRTRRSDALVAELELLRRYSVSYRSRTSVA